MTAETERPHTALPWLPDNGDALRGGIYSNDASGSLIARTQGKGFEFVGRDPKEADANAAYILLACNLFPALVAALEAQHEAQLAIMDDEYPNSPLCALTVAVLAQASSAPPLAGERE